MDAVAVLMWILAAAMVIGGLAGVIYPLLPGLPMMFGGFWIMAWQTQYEKVSAFTLVVLAVFVALGILCDFVASAMGAKKVGASPKAISGALLGSIVGIFFGFPGLILGPFIGAVAGELSHQNRLAAQAAAGAMTGAPGAVAPAGAPAFPGEQPAARPINRAATVGIATWVGLLLGTIAKLAIALAMIGVFAFAWFVV